MERLNIAVIVGSNRRDSLNRKLAQALAGMLRAGIATTFVQIDDLPLYNQDLEGDLPESVARFKSEIAAADGILFVTPEHNRSLPTVLKNAIDWGTRPHGENVWRGKPGAITGTSPGAIGTALGQQHLRQVLGVLGVLVLGGEAYITYRPDLLDDDGTIAEASTRAFLQGYIDDFASLTARIAQPPLAGAA